ncbi:MAG: regulatory iron-sulfur-containing complex subunit RicT [Deltaproteobacteria bacterium]
MERMVSVRLRDTGQNFVYNAHDLEVKENDYVIVEHDRGLDYGQIVSLKAEGAQPAAQEEAPGRVRTQGPQQPIKRIIRVAKEADLKQIEDNRARSKEAFVTCQRKIAEHKLEMKLVQAEYSFDRSKIIFYFTSGGRVDFRNLVKDLAKIFKARIELRQIGVRDETKFFGGFGPCGRQLCCATFLKDFEPVTIKMAKEEGLPLNPPKISGICGRLMCCLNYEYETYKMLSKGLPREGERIVTAEGKGKVININVFKRTATVELEDGKFVEVSYKEKQPGVPGAPCGECCQDKPEICPRQQERSAPYRGERPVPHPSPRGERPERGGRPDNRNERGERGEQRGFRSDRGQRSDNRGERQDRSNRPDQRGDRRNNRDNRDNRGGRLWHRDRDRGQNQNRQNQEKPKQ